MEECGPKALGIVALINFLIGMILAFIGATQLRKFGAAIYTADLVAIATVREMACIMTGIIMCGRTGAAFAAQLGTMKVNQEIEAFQTFGFNPIEFLVLPRMLALVVDDARAGSVREPDIHPGRLFRLHADAPRHPRALHEPDGERHHDGRPSFSASSKAPISAWSWPLPAVCAACNAAPTPPPSAWPRLRPWSPALPPSSPRTEFSPSSATPWGSEP